MKAILIIACLVAFKCDHINASTLASLSNEVKSLKAEVEELKKFKASQATYCSLYSNGKCGPCICKDDFNLPEKFYCDCQNQPAKRDCLAFYQSGYRVDGIYKITMNGYRTTQVFCDQGDGGQGGGWTVIQRRMDGSTNFYRNWQQYKVGFGQLHREFWLGNEYIHLLTAQAIYPRGSEAAVRVRRFPYSQSNKWLSRYAHFQVDNEKSNYMLHVSGCSGSYPYLYKNDKTEFSTYDRDNDKASSYNCAKDYNFGGWWYNGNGNTCTSSQAYANLNGQYDTHNTVGTWYEIFNIGSYKLQFSEIAVRRL